MQDYLRNIKTHTVNVLYKSLGAIHSTKIPTGPTGKRGPPQKVDPFFQNFSGWTEPFHWVLNRNFRKFWLNGSRPLFLIHQRKIAVRGRNYRHRITTLNYALPQIFCELTYAANFLQKINQAFQLSSSATYYKILKVLTGLTRLLLLGAASFVLYVNTRSLYSCGVMVLCVLTF